MSWALLLFGFLTSLLASFGSSSFSCSNWEYECSASQTCISSKWKCDGDEDCVDGEDEKDCVGPVTCQPGYFKCNNSRCIDSSWICDGHPDCPDKEDEAPLRKCNKTSCGPSDFQCGNGDCIRGDFRCDYEADCEDESDEKGCPGLTCTSNQFKCAHNRTCISKELQCNGVHDCTDASDEKGCSSCAANKFQCQNRECIPKLWRCDGDNDCADKSDEVSCPAKPTTMPCRQNKFQCSSGECIENRWKCDKELDCQDGSDEQGCPTETTCSSSQFTCTSGKCIPGKFKCNGFNDCPDSSDEFGCGTTPSPCQTHQFQCGKTSVCIDMSKVCNNIRECPNGDDESLSCNINECADHKGHCHHYCHDLVIGYKCSCNNGYKLANDSRACEDINECEERYGICSQTCFNNKGSYKCGCINGYVEEVNMKTCKAHAPSHYLIFGDEHSVRNVTMTGTQLNVLATNRKAPMAIDFHIQAGYVFWTDILDEKIARTNLRGDGKVETVVHNVKHSNGLAVDWVGNNLYWTDENTKSIEVSQLNGRNRLTLFTVSGDPRGIAVDPFERLLFWSDWGSIRPKIERASMDGNSVSRIVILDTDIIWPTAITLDTIQQRVYLADSKLQKIESCKYDGSSRRTLIPNGILHPLSLSVFEDSLYYTDYSLGKIFSVNKFTGKVERTVKSGLSRPTGIAVVHPLRQNKVATKCSDNNGGCSHLCLLSTNVKKFSCRCPEGMHLHSDGKTCKKIHVKNPVSKPPRRPVTCNDNNGGCSHLCFLKSGRILCNCPKGMSLRQDGITCQDIQSTTTKINGTVSPAHRKSSSSSNPGPLIAGITVAVVFIIFILVAIFLYWRKQSNYRGRTILFYKDNSRVPLQNDFDEDPLKTQEDVEPISTVEFT